MTKQDLRIVYMGTPEFAEYGLRVLFERGYNIVAVVTMPDKPAGRGHQLQASPVKQYAESVGLPVLQPVRLKDEAFIEELRSFHADLQVVTAFRMLPEVVWQMPRFGTINCHASLLPKYRGAAPINWAVINGDKQTGITTFLLKHEIDTGDMLLQQPIDIGDEEDAGSVHDRLMTLGADMVCRTVDLFIEGKVNPTPQPQLSEQEMLPAPKIFKETCEIDFTQPAKSIHDFVRGLSPYPAAWATISLGGKEQVVKIFKTKAVATNNEMKCGEVTTNSLTKCGEVTTNSLTKCGEVTTDGKTFLHIACKDGYLDILELQLPGKKRLPIRDVLNGIK